MESIYAPLMGRMVIVRAHMAGVYVGVVEAVHADGVTLAPGARQLHYWSAGGSCPQIAERGIRHEGSRVTAPSARPVILAGGAGVVSVHEMTGTAWERVMGAPEWDGGL